MCYFPSESDRIVYVEWGIWYRYKAGEYNCERTFSSCFQHSDNQTFSESDSSFTVKPIWTGFSKMYLRNELAIKHKNVLSFCSEELLIIWVVLLVGYVKQTSFLACDKRM